ncbi:CRTAC1 family protein [Tamlana fucoidanivorans]|uniref:CRTAC1 family protein n=1 Tax=Allotamlana fucoidanivorans TaxID=2583814 RepID=A0A5C4SFL8_9FLAO|nr:CRTAC1 family protein [Tamlana fucoidanivorans]TNJ42405.1 CRTAC1 family protein [Tamlana fucoidanivorans]
MRSRNRYDVLKQLPLLVIAYFFFFNVCTAQTSTGWFVEAKKDFPRQEKNLRKWDAPVVADLDQDGYLDLLINDHGYGIQVCWNNKGKFAKPFDIIMGDLHGVSAGDFDLDGNIEVIMSRGGGSGSNARNSKMYRVVGRDFVPMKDFKEPLALMRGRTVQFVDINNDGNLDLLNFAFPDASKKGKSENYIYKNNGQGELVLQDTLAPSKADGQKVLVTDYNGDQVLDLVMYGHGKVKIYKGGDGFTFEDVTKKVLPFDIDNVTGVAEIDFDNDGDFDLYFTRGHDFEIGETFFNSETKDFGFFTKRGKFQFEDLEAGDILSLENFQSQWPNNDTYFIGEASYDYEFEGETHSGKDIRLVNSNALGFPDNTNYEDKKGWYIGFVGNNSWRIAGFLWAPATGVVHGVKNYPAYNHKEGLPDMLLENKGGKFHDVTKKAGVFFNDNSSAVAIADFNNDGFSDILVVPRGNLVYKNKAIIFANRNGEIFKKLENPNIMSPELGAIGMAVETLDYNNDGNVDVVVGNERGKWHLFKNVLSVADIDNKYAIVNIGYAPSKKVSALGAMVTIVYGNQKQQKRVGSTAAQYSLSFNNLIHFGLGADVKSAKIIVTWSNGETVEHKISKFNTQISVGKKRTN